MLAGPIPVPVRMREGHSTPPETVVQYEPLTLSEELEDEFHRLGATSDTLEILKEVEMDQMPQNAAGQIPASIRVAALRCMSHMLQAFGFGGSWFKAAFLLDRCTASNQFQLEQLPLTCVCVARIVLKLASSISLPLGSERCPAINLIKEFATWMEFTHNVVTTEVSDRALCLHEKEVLLALDWQVECPCVEHWSCLYFTRFGILAGREFQASIQQMQAKVLMFARAMVMCFPMTKEVSQRTLAMGLFSLSFVNDGLLPVSSFKPAGISASGWSALFAATQPRPRGAPEGELPQCRLPAAMTMRIMDMISLAVNEEPDTLRGSAGVVVEALGETIRQIEGMQVEGGA